MLTAEEITALQSEVETLRKTNADLVAKHAKDRARIAELESGTTELQGKLKASETALHDARVSAPLKAMAESASKAPELFLEQFSKYFRVELVDSKLTLHSADGKPVVDKDGKPIPFERVALAKFLTEGDDMRAKTFQAITITNWASGAQSTTEPIRRPATPAKQGVKFGLR